MGKVKKSQSVKLGDCNTSARLIDSPDSDPDLDLQGESGWVIVKKQRVTILIPALPVADRLTPQLNHEPRQSENLPIERVDNVAEFSSETKHTLVAPKRPMRIAKKASPTRAQTFPASARPLRQDPRVVSTRYRAIFHRPTTSSPMNQRLRAINLERKLRRAGGLSQWLASLGLGQFARLFQRRGLGKFHLVNMTMKKLEEMGARAVGPRRKLMHAIDCVCQPYCFEALL